MTLLAPLGLLALLSIIVLILIYIIKPNFQQKFISSTFVWKLSLRYKKRKIVTNKLRDIIIIICQILILTCCALILSQPNKVLKQKITNEEVIIILDASSSMNTSYLEQTRFERAVNSAIAQVEQVLDNDGVVTVLTASNTTTFLAQRENVATKDSLIERMRELIDDNACTFYECDMDKAINSCDSILKQNEFAKIYLYTDNGYEATLPDNIVSMKDSVVDKREWNAAILNANAELVDGYYEITIDIATYGQDRMVDVSMYIEGVNGMDVTDKNSMYEVPTEPIFCSRDETMTLKFMYDCSRDDTDTLKHFDLNGVLMQGTDGKTTTLGVYSFKSVTIVLNENDNEGDCYPYDNVFQIYGGEREKIKVLYASYYRNDLASKDEYSNVYFTTVLPTLRSYYGKSRDVDFVYTIANKDMLVPDEKGESQLKGYDFYIFENRMPQILPTDGVVMLCNPDVAPTNADFTIKSIKYIDEGKTRESLIAEDEEHCFLNRFDFEKYEEQLYVTQYIKINVEDDNYRTVLNVNGDPVLIEKNVGASKIVVMAFSLNYSELGVVDQFYYLMENIIDYYFPRTISGNQNAFELDSTITVNSRSESIEIREESTDKTTVYTDKEISFTTNNLGTYTVYQKDAFDKELEEKVFVRTPVKESNIWNVDEKVNNPYKQVDLTQYFGDLLVYFAMALLVLMLVEWILHSSHNM